MEDYYKILGISPNATPQEIADRYRYLVQAYHPDKFSSSGHKAIAEEDIKRINVAYEILADPIKRAEFDRNRSTQYSSYNNKQEQYHNKREQQYTGQKARYTQNNKNSQNFTTPQSTHNAVEHNNKAITSPPKFLLLSLVFIALIVTIIYLANELSAQTTHQPGTDVIGYGINKPSDQNRITATIDYRTIVVNPTETLVMDLGPVLSKTSTFGSLQLFQDDFENETVTNEKWHPEFGDWAVDNGNYVCLTSGHSVAGEDLWDDYIFVVDVMGVNVIDKIVVFRYVSAVEAYGVNLRSNPYNDIVLVKNLPDKDPQILTSSRIVNYNNYWYSIKIILSGTNIQVYIDDHLLIDYNDSISPIYTGKIGVGGMLPLQSKVLFDDVWVTRLNK